MRRRWYDRAPVLWLGCAAVAFTIAAMIRTGRADPCGDSTFVKLSLAGTPERVLEILDGCRPSMGAVDEYLDRDILLIVAYFVTAVFWCFVGSRRSRLGSTRRFGAWLLLCVSLGAAYDLLENLWLRRVVVNLSDVDPPRWAAAFALAKWALLIPAFVFAACAASSSCASLLKFRRPRFGTGERLDVAESDEVRRRYAIPNAKLGEVGVCLSGGGIRAAAVALGGLRALQETGALARVRYLATVSGGGYAGTALHLLSRSDPSPPAFAREAELNHIRRNSRYLWPPLLADADADSFGLPRKWRARRVFTMVSGLFVLAIVTNVALLVTCLYIAARTFGLLLRHVLFGHLGASAMRHSLDLVVVLPLIAVGLAPLLTPGVASFLGNHGAARKQWPLGALATVGLIGAAGLFVERGASTLTIVAVAMIAIKVVVLLAIVERIKWWSHVAGPIVAAAALILFGVMSERTLTESTQGVVVPYRLAWIVGALCVALLVVALVRRPIDPGRPGSTPLAKLAGLIVAAGGIGALLVWFAWSRQGSSAGRVSGAVLAVATVAVAVCIWVEARAVFASSGLVAVASVVVWASFFDPPALDQDITYLISAGLVAFVLFFVDIGRWSPHRIYRRRLANTFGIVEREAAGVRIVPRRAHVDLEPGMPELLICGACYDVHRLKSDTVQAFPFVFAGDVVGGPEVGWSHTEDYRALAGGLASNDVSLLGAMATSGAAVSPGLGQIKLSSLNAVIVLANLRLGVWLPNPRIVSEMRWPDEVPSAEARVRWSQHRSFSYVIKELLGRFSTSGRFVYVTDGGQFDNLGLWELLARRCRTIICVDGSGDAGPSDPDSTGSFAEAAALAAERLKVTFHEPDPIDRWMPARQLDVDDLERLLGPASQSGSRPLLDSNFRRVLVRYPQLRDPRDEPELAEVYLAKSVLTPTTSDLPAVSDYLATSPHDFPGDSTMDQWPDPMQFVAYEQLGESAVCSVLADLDWPVATVRETPTEGIPDGPV